jgi:hypothetical protein
MGLMNPRKRFELHRWLVNPEGGFDVERPDQFQEVPWL